MLVSVFSSLYILRIQNTKHRTIYDILHITAVLIIGSGVAQIIPFTGMGWSVFATSVFVLILTLVYFSF